MRPSRRLLAYSTALLVMTSAAFTAPPRDHESECDERQFWICSWVIGCQEMQEEGSCWDHHENSEGCGLLGQCFEGGSEECAPSATATTLCTFFDPANGPPE